MLKIVIRFLRYRSEVSEVGKLSCINITFTDLIDFGLVHLFQSDSSYLTFSLPRRSYNGNLFIFVTAILLIDDDYLYIFNFHTRSRSTASRLVCNTALVYM